MSLKPCLPLCSGQTRTHTAHPGRMWTHWPNTPQTCYVKLAHFQVGSVLLQQPDLIAPYKAIQYYVTSSMWYLFQHVVLPVHNKSHAALNNSIWSHMKIPTVPYESESQIGLRWDFKSIWHTQFYSKWLRSESPPWSQNRGYPIKTNDTFLILEPLQDQVKFSTSPSGLLLNTDTTNVPISLCAF